jgi:hypothetical protein
MGSDTCCTHLLTGRRFVRQKWYHCRTCFGQGNNLGCCEVCVRICHAGHDVSCGGIGECYCDCGAGAAPSPCQRIPYASMTCRALTETRENSGILMCKTCPKSPFCCVACARVCHAGHILVEVDDRAGRCACADHGDTCKCAGEQVSLCTALRVKNTPVMQPIWDCKTCGLLRDHGCCEVCAMTCHSGHDIVFGGVRSAICGCKFGRWGGCLCDGASDVDHLRMALIRLLERDS